MLEKMVQPLAEVQGLSLVGGKALALGSLIRAGFNVPPGFVVIASSQPKMSAALKKAILEAFDKLGANEVAVRSSAVAEDGISDSWAGQLDSFLNVSRQDLINRVRDCWQSADSERIRAYSKHKGVKPGAVAIIIQKMVKSDVSGVAFSINPLTHSHEVVIEAIRGLGDNLVSGRVTPDTYLTKPKSGSIIKAHLQSEEPVLSSRQVKKIVSVIDKIQDLMGYYVDMEWTFTGEELFILQSRPITGLDFNNG